MQLTNRDLEKIISYDCVMCRHFLNGECGGSNARCEKWERVE